jgi:cyclophilin family peptidyl-prolyl cis-trans isomerase
MTIDRRSLMLGLPLAVAAGNALAQTSNKDTLYLDLKDGRVVIRLRPDLAPKHVEQIKTLAKQGFYDGIVFHRVIEGFMAQTGDPTGTGMGGSKLPNIPAEFSQTPFRRGRERPRNAAERQGQRASRLRPTALSARPTTPFIAPASPASGCCAAAAARRLCRPARRSTSW